MSDTRLIADQIAHRSETTLSAKCGSRTSCRISVGRRARRATSIEECPKSLAETRRLRLGLGTGVVAANQPGSVVRTVPIPTTVPTPTVHIPTVVPTPTVVHPPPIRRGVTHANRTVVGPDT